MFHQTVNKKTKNPSINLPSIIFFFLIHTLYNPYSITIFHNNFGSVSSSHLRVRNKKYVLHLTAIIGCFLFATKKRQKLVPVSSQTLPTPTQLQLGASSLHALRFFSYEESIPEIGWSQVIWKNHLNVNTVSLVPRRVLCFLTRISQQLQEYPSNPPSSVTLYNISLICHRYLYLVSNTDVWGTYKIH